MRSLNELDLTDERNHWRVIEIPAMDREHRAQFGYTETHVVYTDFGFERQFEGREEAEAFIASNKVS